MDAAKRLLEGLAAKPKLPDPSVTIPPVIDQDGFLSFAPGDIENPKEWSPARRWYCTCVAIILVVNATFASSSPSACLAGIAEEFNVSVQVAGLVVTVFLLGYCAGPLLFAPLSEFYGRQGVFYITFTGFFAFNFLCAFAPSFSGLLVGRLISGIFASAPLTNAPGVVSDLWDPIERGNAMAIFAMMTVLGPALGPVISGFLQSHKNWRWIFYVMIWMAFVTQLFVFTIPETLPSAVLIKKLRRLKRQGLLESSSSDLQQALFQAENKKLTEILKEALRRPWRILLDPIALLIAIYISTVYVLQYMLFTIYPIIFRQRRGWAPGISELPLLGTAVGGCMGGLFIFHLSNRDKRKLESGIVRRPEDRLPAAMIGGVGFAATMFWFAWAAAFDYIHWFVPTLAGTCLSFFMVLIFVSNLNYLTDTYLAYTASAMAANTITRSACGAAAPLFTQRMFDALGIGGGGSLVGGMGVLLAPIPFIFYRYGEYIRKKSKFASSSGQRSAAYQARGSSNVAAV